MIKLIVFDLDGVLLDSREIHFESLNLALAEVGSHYVITRPEQDNIYEGLTTRDKLQILTKLKGLPSQEYDSIWVSKQKYSTKLFEDLSIDQGLVDLLTSIRNKGILIAVASNSIRATLELCLNNLGVLPLVDLSLSNEDVKTPKPDPEIYIKSMNFFGVSPEETAIFEDSSIGRQAAKSSGAFLIEVDSRADVTLEKIHGAIHGYKN